MKEKKNFYFSSFSQRKMFATNVQIFLMGFFLFAAYRHIWLFYHGLCPTKSQIMNEINWSNERVSAFQSNALIAQSSHTHTDTHLRGAHTSITNDEHKIDKHLLHYETKKGAINKRSG